MTYQFTIQSIRPTRGGYGEVTNLTALRVTNARYWSFQPVAEDQDKVSSFRVRHKLSLPALDLSEGYRWAAGWMDGTTGVFDGSREVYAGYVRMLGNGGQGQLKHLDFTCSGFQRLFTGTYVHSWPDPADFFALYPLERSAREWLVGSVAEGAPYDGILRQRLAGYPIDWSGVDPEFDDVIFGRGSDGFYYLPGKSVSEAPYRGRAFRCLMLDEVLDDILETIRLARPAMDPVAWFEPVVNPANGTEIIPKFRLRDRNSTDAAPVATYATHPGTGEWQIENPALHERDWTEVASRIIVKSAGFELVAGVPQIKYAVGYDETKASRYQTTWQTDDGWADLIRDETIPTIAECQVLAETQRDYRWGAQGRLGFRSSHYVPQGSMIRVNWPEEGQDYALHRVSDITLVPNLGRPLYDLQCGARKPDTAGLFQRQGARLTRQWNLSRAGAAPGSNGAPQGRALNTSPTHDGQNRGQAANDQTPFLTIEAGYVPPGEERTPEVVNRLNLPAPDGSAGTSVSDHDGRPHPQVLLSGDLIADETIGLGHFRWQAAIAVLDVVGTGVVWLQRDGVDVAGPFTFTGPHTVQAVTPAVVFLPGERVQLVVTGTDAGDPLSVDVSEA